MLTVFNILKKLFFINFYQYKSNYNSAYTTPNLLKIELYVDSTLLNNFT